MAAIARAGVLASCAGLLTPAASADAAPPVSATIAVPVGVAEHQAACAGKDGWSDPAPPVRVFANVYNVGTCGIVALLLVGDKGHILIDAATTEAAPSIIANVRRLGIRPGDIKILLSSHEHVDHVGGLSEIRRPTSATLMAVAAAKPALESGTSSAGDPQRGSLHGFAGVPVGRVLRDGEMVALGSLRLTVHATPGHAPGSTSWSWSSCAGGVCHAMVYADSLSAVSADAYRFSDHPAYVAAFRASIAKVAALPCDLVITPHPGASNLYERLGGKAPLSAPNACAAYAAASCVKLDQRLASEAAVGAQRAGAPHAR